MYKVFINNKPCCLSTQSVPNPDFLVIDFNGLKLDYLFRTTQKTSCIGIWIQTETLEKDWQKFKNLFTYIEAAGGLAFNKELGYLFIKRFGYWDLPKGHIEKGESPELAAVREVEEETGAVDLQIVKSLQSSYHVFRYPGASDWRLKKTYWFSMTVDGIENLKAQTEEGIQEVVFKKDFLEVLQNTYPNIKDLLLTLK